MKLIDLLVQELPKRGGWPAGAEFARAYPNDKYLWFFCPDDYPHQSYPAIEAKDITEHGVKVTCAAYNNALAASQQPTWNGEGRPPVGAVVELMDDSQSSTWGEVTIKFYGDAFAVWDDHGQEESNSLCHVRVRPIRTEADRKRDDALSDLESGLGHAHGLFDLMQIYNLIASGMVRGIKLESS
ncbi:hypothetical protein PQD17_gp39 [Pantoea phage PdC23]|uniref:Uncharacterized protein n=1 Tax=Pantoea phage PdC23 TaxID=2894356 RepID=A0AAE9C7I1_9CAUD|nr:hypothetical protein PQD17_gp39 [Pantoea phage PdC23]UGC97752.1 hypothetical protein pdc_039 [Pantoea phage PdC23]